MQNDKNYIKIGILVVFFAILRFRFSSRCSGSQTFDRTLCTCSDGSTPRSSRTRAVCSDNSRPDCSGACPDGSDPGSTPKLLLM